MADINTGYTPAPVTTPQHIPDNSDIAAVDHGLPSWSWISWYNRVDGFIQQFIAFMAIPAVFATAAWTDYTPTTTNLTSVTVNKARYLTGGKTGFLRVRVTGTSNGTFPTFTLPFTLLDDSQTFAAYYAQAGNRGAGMVEITAGVATFRTYNNTALGLATVYTFQFEGPCELA